MYGDIIGSLKLRNSTIYSILPATARTIPANSHSIRTILHKKIDKELSIVALSIMNSTTTLTSVFAQKYGVFLPTNHRKSPEVFLKTNSKINKESGTMHHV